MVLYIWRKNVFICQHNFKKKSHSKLSKNQPVCMSKRLVCWIRAGGGSSAWGGGIVWNTLKGGRIEMRGVERNILKGEGKLG